VWKTEEKPKCEKLENWKRRAEAEAAAEEENLELRKLRNGKRNGRGNVELGKTGTKDGGAEKNVEL